MNKIMNFLKNKEIVMYTSQNCKYCASTKETFEKANLEYIEKDIKEYPDDWHVAVSTTGMPVTPAILYMGDYFLPARDFPNPEILVKILEDYKSIDTNGLTMERLKTLNHNINQAFNAVDNRLKLIEESLNTLKNNNGKKPNNKKAKK